MLRDIICNKIKRIIIVDEKYLYKINKLVSSFSSNTNFKQLSEYNLTLRSISTNFDSNKKIIYYRDMNRPLNQKTFVDAANFFKNREYLDVIKTIERNTIKIIGQKNIF